MRLTISNRLYGAFGLVVLALLSSALLVFKLSQTAEQRFEEGRAATLQTAALADAQSGLWGLRWGVAQMVALKDESERAKVAANGPKLRETVDKALGQLGELIHDPDQQKELKDLKRVFGQYADARAQWSETFLKGDLEGAAKIRAEKTTPLGGATVKAFSDLIEKQRNSARESHEAAQKQLAFWRALVLGFIVVAALGALVLVVLVVRSIVTPLAYAKGIAESVAAGDLSRQIDTSSNDEVGDLVRALKAMNDSLSGIVSRVRQASDSITTGSGEIAAGSADLSQRTEQQASSLQQTASSMEQLTATVKNNAETSHQANQLASSASHAALQGGEVMSKVVGTMEDISQSSRKISDIIGVIDGIAFQTNILALNAAVEAARAGEQGRGFAVVASEVRSLAQRSANAAREIKSLIGESVAKVEAGSSLVNTAGQSMQEIVTQVRRVTDLIADISAASSEQAQGIGQVSTAVSQLDHVTQQNAALVEESAAAAESLRHQATLLNDVMASFKLGRA